jgi:hypothetical protein
MKQV